MLKRGQLIKTSVFLPKLIRLLRGCQFLWSNKSRRSVRWERCCCSVVINRWIQPLGLCDVWCAQMFPPEKKQMLIRITHRRSGIKYQAVFGIKEQENTKAEIPITLSPNLLVCYIHSFVLLSVPKAHPFTYWHAFKGSSRPVNGCVQAQHRL